MTEEVKCEEEKKTGFLQASPGEFSTMRAGFWVCILNAIAQSWFAIWKGDSTGMIFSFVVLFLITAFGGKGLQSFAEKMAPPKTPGQ